MRGGRGGPTGVPLNGEINDLAWVPNSNLLAVCGPDGLQVGDMSNVKQFKLVLTLAGVNTFERVSFQLGWPVGRRGVESAPCRFGDWIIPRRPSGHAAATPRAVGRPRLVAHHALAGGVRFGRVGRSLGRGWTADGHLEEWTHRQSRRAGLERPVVSDWPCLVRTTGRVFDTSAF